MRQLTSLDTQFLAIEDGRQAGHVGSLGIYDPSTAPGGACLAISDGTNWYPILIGGTAIS